MEKSRGIAWRLTAAKHAELMGDDDALKVEGGFDEGSLEGMYDV